MHASTAVVHFPVLLLKHDSTLPRSNTNPFFFLLAVMTLLLEMTSLPAQTSKTIERTILVLAYATTSLDEC